MRKVKKGEATEDPKGDWKKIQDIYSSMPEGDQPTDIVHGRKFRNLPLTEKEKKKRMDALLEIRRRMVNDSE
jgi:hypothetical protein